MPIIAKENPPEIRPGARVRADEGSDIMDVPAGSLGTVTDVFVAVDWDNGKRVEFTPAAFKRDLSDAS